MGDAFRWFGQRPISLLLIATPNTALSVASLFAAYNGPVALYLLLNIVSLVVGEIVTAALIYATYRISVGQSFGINEMFQLATDRLGSLIAYSFRYIGAILLLFITIVGIPFAVRVGVRWWFGTQAIVLNDETPKEAISHSCRLVSGIGWQILGTLILLSLPSLAFFIISIVTRGSLAVGLMSTVTGALITPLVAAFWTALYLQLDAQDRAARAAEPAP